MILKIQGKCISKDNSKIRNKQGRYFLSTKYKDYEKGVALQAISQKPKDFKIFNNDLLVIVTFYFTSKVHGDICNLTKSLFDSLIGIIYKDDKQIKDCQLLINYVKENPMVLLSITEIK